jgi:RNA polymerase sigma-70 factor (ECF subfamily)
VITSSQRNAIEWASFDGLTMKEIAEKTGESLVALRHHFYRGLRKLRAASSAQRPNVR